MKCKNDVCVNQANPNMGTGMYCSRSCANRRVHSSSTKKKISEGVKRTGVQRPPLSEESLAKWQTSIRTLYDSRSFDELGERGRRKHILKEQDSRCLECGLSEWQNRSLTLELDHIDGNRKNNTRGNLRFLCPNCHSLTKTWRGRNQNQNQNIKLSDDEILAVIKENHQTMTGRQILIKLNLVPTGNNYKRLYKLMTAYLQSEMQSK